METSRLSIVIPTYDRPAQLMGTLQALFAVPLPPEVEVVILDNQSPAEVEPVVRALPGVAADRIRFVRNAANIGLAANILRCFEVAQAPWVWTLGDDDPPVSGAVRSVLHEIGEAKEKTMLLKFNSTNGGQVEKHHEILGLEELSRWCSDIKFYSNLLFISSGVFRKGPVLSRLNVGHHWAYSLSPHIAILLHGMAAGFSVKLVPQNLVRHGLADPAQQWNVLRLRVGFPTLAEVEGTEAFAGPAFPKLALAYVGRGWWRDIAFCFLTDNHRTPVFWRGYYCRYASTIGGLQGWLMNQAAWGLCLLRSFGIRLKPKQGPLAHGDATGRNLQRS
jgi:hypothetical protein